MLNRPSSTKLSAISFKTYRDILSFMENLNQQFNLQNPDFHAAFHKQFIVATNGRTYLLNDILQLNEKDIERLKLTFLSDSGNIDVPSIQKQVLENHKEFKLTNNRTLSNLFLDLSLNPRASLLYVDLPTCGINRFPIIFPSITASGYTYESYSIDSMVYRRANDPMTQVPLHESEVVKDLSLKDLIWVIYQSRFKYLAKLVNTDMQANTEERQETQDLIAVLEEQKVNLRNHISLQMNIVSKMFATFNKTYNLLRIRRDLAIKTLPRLSQESLMLNRVYKSQKAISVFDTITGAIAFLVSMLNLYSFLTNPGKSNPTRQGLLIVGLGNYDIYLVPLILFMNAISTYRMLLRPLYNSLVLAPKTAKELEVRQIIIEDKMLSDYGRHETSQAIPKMVSLKTAMEKLCESSPLRANSILRPPVAINHAPVTLEEKKKLKPNQ